MDYWKIGCKAGVLAYVAAVSTVGGSVMPDGWHVLAYLTYVIVNIAMPLFRSPVMNRTTAALSAALVAGAAYGLEPTFALLLPMAAYELAVGFRAGRAVTLAAMLLPAAALPSDAIPLYALVSVLAYLLLANVDATADKLVRFADDKEKLKAELDRLGLQLRESSAYLKQTEYTVKLEERNRLSQQIHDDVGHAMSGALIQMEASRRLLDTDRAKALELLGNAIAISKEGLERIRQTLHSVKPKPEELGVHRLRLQAEELSARQGVAVTLSHEGDLDAVTPLQWKIIHDNATEAITNALKYARATAIHIDVRVLNRYVQSIVTDNGVGAAKVIKGLGIVGMEERAAAVGGTVVADGTKGFSVTTLLPRGSGRA